MGRGKFIIVHSVITLDIPWTDVIKNMAILLTVSLNERLIYEVAFGTRNMGLNGSKALVGNIINNGNNTHAMSLSSGQHVIDGNQWNY